MRKSEILFRAMQIAGIPNVDENRAKMVLAFQEKLERYGLRLSIQEIEETGMAVTKQIQAENNAMQAPMINKATHSPEEVKAIVDEITMDLSKGGEA